jgi:sulfoxide reductase catalytic subunit YedY
MLWLLNGLIFYILIFSTGHWQRLVPTSWDYAPNAISVGIQYLSLDWPPEMGWTAYNALQPSRRSAMPAPSSTTAQPPRMAGK